MLCNTGYVTKYVGCCFGSWEAHLGEEGGGGGGGGGGFGVTGH